MIKPKVSLDDYITYLDEVHKKSMAYIQYLEDRIKNAYMYDVDRDKILDLIADGKNYMIDNLDKIAEVVNYTEVHQIAIMRDIKIDDILE